MQGQKGAIGSLPESVAMEHGSASSDSSVGEPQICWTNFMRTTPANNPSDLYLNGANQQSQTVNMWSMGESSSNTLPIQMGQNRADPKTEHGNIGHLSGPLFTQTSRPESVHNATVNPSTFTSIKPSNYASSSSSDPFDLENRHLPCKRKAAEISIGQSSSGIETSSIFQRAEGSTSVWRSFSENSSSSNSIPSDPINPRLGLAVGGFSSDSRSLENSRRNVRIRINNSRHQDSLPAINNNNNNNTNNNATDNNLINGQLNFSSAYPSLGLNPVAATGDNSLIHESQPVLRAPTLRRNLQLSSRSRSSSSRANRSVSLNNGSSGDNSITLPTNISDHPLFVQPPAINWNLNSSNVTNSGNGSSIASTTNPMPNLGLHRGSSHHPSRRLSEILRRSLLSSVDSVAAAGGVSGGQTSNLFSRIPPQVGGSAASSQEAGITPIIGMPGHHHRHRHHQLQHHLAQLRSSETQIDGPFGFPYLARAVAGGSERRGRLVSEIRNVLDLIRRGEGLRFEDVMLLDQSMFYGMADIHDRHRDMRLDIDNMSYEELLALEERIGNVNTGLTEESISSCMKLKTYVTVAGQPDAEPCCICQEEYKNGDDLGGLKCGHDFHTNCIKKWLLQKNVCPVCKSAATKTKDEA